MLKFSKKKTVKGIGFGDEAVIGELVKYRKGDMLGRGRARIAMLEADVCDFDLLFEVSQEYLGIICIGDYKQGVAEMAEELRLVGLFTDEESRLFSSVNEKMILLPKKSRAVLAPDMSELREFERDVFAVDIEEEKETCGKTVR